MYPKSLPYILLGLCLLLFPLSRAEAQALSGTYTIGPSAMDHYSSITAAVNALKVQGVSGPVVFKVGSGNYTEQVAIPAISGASATNSITFRSASGDSTAVVLRYASSSATANYVLKLDGADHIRFEKITVQALGNSASTYARVVEIGNGANYNTFSHCQLRGNPSTSGSQHQAIVYSFAGNDEYNTFRACRLDSGSYAFFLNGPSASTLERGTVLDSNIITNFYYYGIQSYYQDGIRITNDSFYSTSSQAAGMYLRYCDNGSRVEGNKIFNMVRGGMDISYGDATSDKPAFLVNNMISVNSTGSSTEGIALGNSHYWRIYHNSIWVRSSYSGGVYALSVTGSNNEVYNNILAGSNYGRAMSYAANAVSASDYNLLFSEREVLCYYASTAAADIHAWRSLAGLDQHSSVYSPRFPSLTNLHCTYHGLNNKGKNLSGLVPKDIKGNSRSTTPDLGAIEFTPSVSPLAGTYSIPGHYNSFAAAIQALDQNGISGSVTFNVANGTYSERIIIPAIVGASASRRITFQSASNDSTLVILSSTPTSAENYVVKFDNAAHVTFRGMTLQALGTGEGRVVEIAGRTDSVQLLNNILSGITGSINDSRALVYSDGTSNDNYIAFRHNLFLNGSYGIFMKGYQSYAAERGLVIENNTFSNFRYRGVYLFNNDGAVIQNDSFYTTNPSTYGIHIYNAKGQTIIANNKINVIDLGIYLSYAYGTSSVPVLVANNMISMGGTGSDVQGMYIYTSDYARIYHNTVRLSNNSASSYAGKFWNSDNIDIRNNILSNFGTGPVIQIISSSNPFSDHNDFYSLATQYYAYWNTGFVNSFAAWQTTSSLDSHSVSIDPQYVSSSDLHATARQLDNKGTNLSSIVAYDIDGEVRAAAPDMGADEFAAVAAPLSGTYTIDPSGTGSRNYTSFELAVDDLRLNGVNGAVVFEVANGTFNEQIFIPQITGTSAANTITFRSASGDSSLTILSYAPASDNYVVKLEQVDHIRFHKLTLQNTNPTGSLNTVVEFGSGSDYFQLTHCRIISGGRNSDLVYSRSSNDQSTLIRNCYLSGGNSSIELQGTHINPETGLVIDSNTFTGFHNAAMELRYMAASDLRYNTITGNANQYGMYIYDMSGAARIEFNKITNVKEAGIQLQESDARSGNGLLANNTVYISGGSSVGYGIYMSQCHSWQVYHNSVNVEQQTSSSALYIAGGSGNDIRNNIFANNGGGLAVNVANTTSVSVMDYNDLYTTSATRFGRLVSVESSNFAGWKTLSGYDIHSISQNPRFASTADLHATSCAIADKGTDVSSVVSVDMDGQSRSATPDMGADEFNTGSAPGIWIGTVSDDWFNAANWCSNTVPDAGVDVEIYSSALNMPKVASGTADARNILIASGARLSMQDAVLNVSGTFADSGQFIRTGTNSVSFTGTGAYTIPAGAYHNLTINGTGQKTVRGNIIVSGALTMTAGVLLTNNDTITLGSAATLTESTTSYVTGFVRTSRDVSATGSYDFGGIGMQAVFGGSTLPGMTTVVRVTGDNAILTGQSGSKSIKRHFKIDAPVSSGLSYTLRFYYMDSELNGITEANLALFSAPQANGDFTWLGFTNRSTSANYVEQNGLQSFSVKTLGNSSNPLPVELVGFEATADGETANLKWTTISETNNKGFEIWRSLDGVSWELKGWVDGHGTTQEVNSYTWTDETAQFDLTRKGQSAAYYRLRQVDFNNTSEWSDVRSVRFKLGSDTKVAVRAFPNPFSNSLQISLQGVEKGSEVSIRIFNLNGQLVAQQNVEAATQVQLSDLSQLPSGIYLLDVQGGGVWQQIRLVKE